jgi:hypothetical protein
MYPRVHRFISTPSEHVRKNYVVSFELQPLRWIWYGLGPQEKLGMSVYSSRLT